MLHRRPSAIEGKMPHKHALMVTPGLTVAVCRYAPGEQHKLHTDRHPRVSFLLRGGYREEGRSGSIRMRPGDVLLKSHRAKHEDRFSDDGAWVAAIEFLDNDPFCGVPESRLWCRRADAFALRHANAFLEAARAGDANGAGAAGVDLVTASVHEDEHIRRPPTWLHHLKLELEECSLASIDVAARARAAGVHPTHASRLFRQCYGTSITEHAHAHSIRRAVAPLAQTDLSLSDVALVAGFYDQSHMSRVFRRMLGRTPGAQRTLLVAAIG